MDQQPFGFLFSPSMMEAQLRELRQENQASAAAMYAQPSQSQDTADDGHKVVHDYTDHADDTDGEFLFNHLMRPSLKVGSNGASVEQPFPVKLYFMLNDLEGDNLGHIVSWQPHGRCFVVHDANLFRDFVLTNYFRQTKLASFQRQLNIYGFKRLTTGPDKGGYYHELFLRGRPWLAHSIKRIKLKGTGTRKASSPDTEPKFYTMTFLPMTNTAASTAAMNAQRNPNLGCLTTNNSGSNMLQNMAPSLLSPASQAGPTPLQLQVQQYCQFQQLQQQQHNQQLQAAAAAAASPMLSSATLPFGMVAAAPADQDANRELFLAAVNNAPGLWPFLG